MGSVIGEITGTNAAASNAINAQKQAAEASNATQKQIYDQERQDSSAYRDAGTKALSSLSDPNLTRSFSSSDYQSSPGYQFQMDQGLQALNRSAAAKGGILSGAAVKSALGYSQGLANQDYQQAYSNFKNDQNQRLSQLSGIASMGQNAIAGTQSAAQNYGNNVSQTQMGVGNATAAAGIGAANANAQLIGQGATAAMLFSDERLKTNIEPISKEDLKELKSHLRALKFDYTHSVFGPENFYGVMAQDLEKSKLGRTCVVEDEFGNKKIDPKRAMSIFLASMAEG